MSAFYLDILKDRLYTAKASSRERRSGQTALYKILLTLVRLMAPVLSFTADEVWAYMPGGKKAVSVFLADFPKPEDKYLDDKLEARWEKLQAVRGEAAKVLESLRKDKKIGHSLDASVTLYAEQGLYDLLKQYEQDLPFIFIASQVAVAKEAEAPSDAFASDVIKGLRIAAGPAKGQKCGRCWMYQESVGTVKDHPQICGRCAGNLA
jgi:isoleucyl-tRNA synthetase